MQPEGLRRQDGNRGRCIASPGQDVENDVARVEFGAERLGTGRLDRTEAIGQYRPEDVDHLPITVIGGSELATNTLECAGQQPVLEGCAVAQRSRLARLDRHVMPGIVDCLAAPETAPMLGDDHAILADHNAVGVGMDLDWATQRLRYDRVLVVVETDETGLRDGSRDSVEPVEPPSITNQAWPLGLEDRPDCLVATFGMRMRLGIGNALIDQPTIYLLVGAEPQPRREEALAHQPHLVLHLPFSQPVPGVQAVGSTK